MERLVTTSEAAQILGLSLQGVHYRIKKEQLKSIKKDGKTFVYVDESQKYIEEEATTVKVKEQTIKQNYVDNSQAIIDVKNEQIELLKKSMKWMKKQYISEIFRLEKNQKKIIEVFNSEIKLLQSAFNEMRSIYKPQIQQEIKNKTEKESKDFIMVKDFFILMKRYNKTEQEIKLMIFNGIKTGDRRFVYNKIEKKLLILNSDFIDLI
ncbi:MAG: helix-turn-helix domain-containing protein [Aliarcobacter sp.]|nr:helix-turn-helix domain-containing protein [Aliarcobacter sp.]